MKRFTQTIKLKANNEYERKKSQYCVYDFELNEMIEASIVDSCLAIDDTTYVSKASFPDQFGKLDAYHINIGKGIRFAFETITASRDLVIHHTAEMPDNILGSFFLSGDFRMKYKNHNQSISKHKSDIVWSHTPGDTYTSFLPANRTSRSAFIIIKPQIFDTIQENDDDVSNTLWDIFRGKKEGICTAGRLPSDDSATLQEILDMRPEKPWDWLNIESKVIELVGNSLSRYENEASSTAGLTLFSGDIDKIRAARDILIENMEDPPSIIKLARLSGINEFKLKRGFKYLYSNTIYGYLRRYRLERAYHLLERGEMNVTETALRVGYSNPSAFTAAFKKEYGFNPVECRRKLF